MYSFPDKGYPPKKWIETPTEENSEVKGVEDSESIFEDSELSAKVGQTQHWGSLPMAEISNDEARDSGSVLEKEDQGAKVAISEHTVNLPVFVNEQSVTVESGWTTGSLEMACPVSGAISEPLASVGNASTTEFFASDGNESTSEPFVLAGNQSTAVSCTNSDGVVPVLRTVLDDFEPNSTSCVLSEPASSWSVPDNNVDIVDELNGQSLTDGREGWEHNASAVDPNREDREQSIEAMNLQTDTKSGDWVAYNGELSDNFVT